MVRSLLSRLARILLRIAQMLDRNLVGERVVVIPEHLAAMRSRYPGAPKHWLEAVARRVTLAEPDVVARPPDESPGPFRSPGEAVARSRKSAPVAPFGRSRLRAAAEFAGIIRNSSRPSFDRQDRAAPNSPPVGFARCEQGRIPSASIRPLPSRTPRQEPPWIRFDEADPLVPQPQVETSSAGTRQTEFPQLGARQAVEPGAQSSPRGSRANRPPSMFPEWPSRDGSWRERFGAGIRDRVRVEPEFPEPPNPWPMLPALLVDEASSSFLDRDEAALLNEQVVGTWSA
jgi:hypothetical protein